MKGRLAKLPKWEPWGVLFRGGVGDASRRPSSVRRQASTVERIADDADLSIPLRAVGERTPLGFVEVASLLARGGVGESNRVRLRAVRLAFTPHAAPGAREVRRGPPGQVARGARCRGVANLRPAVDREPAAIVVDVLVAVAGR